MIRHVDVILSPIEPMIGLDESWIETLIDQQLRQLFLNTLFRWDLSEGEQAINNRWGHIRILWKCTHKNAFAGHGQGTAASWLIALMNKTHNDKDVTMKMKTYEYACSTMLAMIQQSRLQTMSTKTPSFLCASGIFVTLTTRLIFDWNLNIIHCKIIG